jgi:hypothetical protein
MTSTIQLNYVDEAGAIIASPVFYLDAADVSINNAASIEDFAIPGQPWNAWFNNNNVTRTWQITGKFKATDAPWDVATSDGRPLDFEFYLSCFLNALDSTTGRLLPNNKYGFALTMKQVFNGVTYSRSTNTNFSEQTVRLFYDTSNVKFSGGSPGVVDYSVAFKEGEQQINMGV